MCSSRSVGGVWARLAPAMNETAGSRPRARNRRRLAIGVSLRVAGESVILVRATNLSSRLELIFGDFKPHDCYENRRSDAANRLRLCGKAGRIYSASSKVFVTI